MTAPLRDPYGADGYRLRAQDAPAPDLPTTGKRDPLFAPPPRREGTVSGAEMPGDARPDWMLASETEILQRLAELEDEYADLAYLYNNGSDRWDKLRKGLLSRIKGELRGRYAEAAEKVTEARLEDEAHAHPEYLDFLRDMRADAPRFERLRGRIAILHLRLAQAGVRA